ncbi:hypothetical protein WAE56_18005, partial [Iodobacter sp. LRB]|uniref:hypothetical protein n=1 Tax=Iodobacter sp. LRB TaxID=3127955 RepID=UPI00307D3F0A
PESIKVIIPATKSHGCHTYSIGPQKKPFNGYRRDGPPKEESIQISLFPLINGSDGVPWAVANMWLLSIAKLKCDSRHGQSKN